MSKTKHGAKLLKELYEDQKKYLIEERGWTIDHEYEDGETCTFVHPEYEGCVALINDSDITFTQSYEIKVASGRTESGLIEIPEDLVGRITID